MEANDATPCYTEQVLPNGEAMVEGNCPAAAARAAEIADQAADSEIKVIFLLASTGKPWALQHRGYSAEFIRKHFCGATPWHQALQSLADDQIFLWSENYGGKDTDTTPHESGMVMFIVGLRLGARMRAWSRK